MSHQLGTTKTRQHNSSENWLDKEKTNPVADSGGIFLVGGFRKVNLTTVSWYLFSGGGGHEMGYTPACIQFTRIKPHSNHSKWLTVAGEYIGPLTSSFLFFKNLHKPTFTRWLLYHYKLEPPFPSHVFDMSTLDEACNISFSDLFVATGRLNSRAQYMQAT